MKAVDNASSHPQISRTSDFSEDPGHFKLIQEVSVQGHGKLTIRPIRGNDQERMARFHAQISEESIYLRYFENLGLDQRTTHERLIGICANTFESYAVVVEQPAVSDRPAAVLAVGRLTLTSEPYRASFDTLMIDGEKVSQLGRVLLRRLIKVAHAFGFQILTGNLLVADHDALNLCRVLGFSLQILPEGGLVHVKLDLK